MRASAVVAITLLLGAGPAFATPAADLEKEFRAIQHDYVPEGVHRVSAPRFEMDDRNVRITDDDLYIAYIHLGGIDSEMTNVAIGLAADGKSAWLGGDIRFTGDCGGGSTCGMTLGRAHVSGVFELDRDGWEAVVWNIAATDRSSDHAGLAAIPAKTDGADAAAKLFQSTIGDPKALAASLSDRKDVLLYGSDDGERFVGATKVKAQLAAWKLAFAVNDGVRAGTSASGSLAWVAANVNATPVGKPKSKPTAYRALFVYEHVGDAWKLVQLQFSGA